MTKIISYTALHYGKEYLYYAIKSVIDQVDEHWVLYSNVGSHGSHAPMPCPDSRADLFAQAKAAAGDKLRWTDGTWPYEGAQRDHINYLAPDADLILVVDADEIWQTGLAKQAIVTALADGEHRTWRLPIIHYWRSFYRAVLHDPAYPHRVLRPKNAGGDTTLNTGLVINHMGYAQDPLTVYYKQFTHGHRGEWRKDDWFNRKYLANAQTDCHPVGSEYWNPEQVDPCDHMPDFMREHPYWNQDVIGDVREVAS